MVTSKIETRETDDEVDVGTIEDTADQTSKP